MPKRTQRQSTKHDNAVQDVAKRYEGLGYNVRADISGYDKPKSIQNKRPDVTATKNGEKIIVEVETLDSMGTDKAQREVFRDYTNSHKNTRFRTKLAK